MGTDRHAAAAASRQVEAETASPSRHREGLWCVGGVDVAETLERLSAIAGYDDRLSAVRCVAGIHPPLAIPSPGNRPTPRTAPSGYGIRGLLRGHLAAIEGTAPVNRTTSFPRLPIRPGDDPIVSHAGARVLPDLADALGMTAGLSAAGDGMKPRQRGHDRGLVLVNLAAVMDGGATSLSDRELFIRQPDVLGSGPRCPPPGGPCRSSTTPSPPAWPRPGRLPMPHERFQLRPGRSPCL